MSIWSKMLLGVVLLAVLGAGLGFWMDLYGIRRGCLSPQLDQAGYQSAWDLYAQANVAAGAHRYAAASDMLDLALSRLGDGYQLGRGADETDQLVSAAKAAAARSEFEVAARLKLEAMARRTWLFQRKTRLAQVCHAVARKWHLA